MYKKALLTLVFLVTTLQFSTIFAYTKAEFVKVTPVLENNLSTAESKYDDKCNSTLWKAYRKLNSCFDNLCTAGNNSITDARTALYNFNYIVNSINYDTETDLLSRANTFYWIADKAIINAQNVTSRIEYTNCSNDSYTTWDFWNPSTTTWNYSSSYVNESDVNTDNYIENNTEDNWTVWYDPTTWFNDNTNMSVDDVQNNNTVINNYSKDVVIAEENASTALVKREELDSIDTQIRDLETSIQQKESVIPWSTTTDEQKALDSLKTQKVTLEQNFTTDDQTALAEYDKAEANYNTAKKLASEWKVLKPTSISTKDLTPTSISTEDLLKDARSNPASTLSKAEVSLKKDNELLENEKKNIEKAKENLEENVKKDKLKIQEQADKDIKDIKISSKELGDYNNKIISETNKICSDKWFASNDCNNARKKQAEDLKNAKINIITDKEKKIQEKADKDKSQVKWSLLDEIEKEENKINNKINEDQKKVIEAKNKEYDKITNDYDAKVKDYKEKEKNVINAEKALTDAKKAAENVCNAGNNSEACKNAQKNVAEKEWSLNKAKIAKDEADADKKIAWNNSKVTEAKNQKAINDQLTVNRLIKEQKDNIKKAEDNEDKICSESPKSKKCKDIKEVTEAVKNTAKTAMDTAQKKANESKVDAAQSVLDNPDSSAKDKSVASKTLVSAAQKKLNAVQKKLNTAQWIYDACETDACRIQIKKDYIDPANKDVEKAKKAIEAAEKVAKDQKEAYLKTPEAKEDITTRVFTISVNDITPGMKVKWGSLEETVNFALGTIIQKLMIGLGSLSILIMTVGAWYIVLHNWQDELLNKWKSIFMSWIYAMIVALTSYYLIVIVRYLLYH